MADTEDIRKDESLKNHLSTFNIYDLERLKECFEYEYSIEPENRDAISEILKSIKTAIEDKREQ